jgi:hypothetical protein
MQTKLLLDLHGARPAPTEPGCRPAYADRRSGGATGQVNLAPVDGRRRATTKATKASDKPSTGDIEIEIEILYNKHRVNGCCFRAPLVIMPVGGLFGT